MAEAEVAEAETEKTPLYLQVDLYLMFNEP